MWAEFNHAAAMEIQSSDGSLKKITIVLQRIWSGKKSHSYL